MVTTTEATMVTATLVMVIAAGVVVVVIVIVAMVHVSAVVMVVHYYNTWSTSSATSHHISHHHRFHHHHFTHDHSCHHSTTSSHSLPWGRVVITVSILGVWVGLLVDNRGCGCGSSLRDGVTICVEKRRNLRCRTLRCTLDRLTISIKLRCINDWVLKLLALHRGHLTWLLRRHRVLRDILLLARWHKSILLLHHLLLLHLLLLHLNLLLLPSSH